MPGTRGDAGVRPLRYLGGPSAAPGRAATRFDNALAKLVTDLLDTVAEPGRAPLAANQIGSSLAVFSYNIEDAFGYVINPVVVETSGEPRPATRPACRCRASAPTGTGPRTPS